MTLNQEGKQQARNFYDFYIDLTSIVKSHQKTC